MPVTTSSAYTAEPGATTLTLTYPAGSVGDTLLIWHSTQTSAALTESGNLTVGEQLAVLASTGRLRVYKRTRQSGDTSATWTAATDQRMAAVVANVPADMDTTDPTSTTVFADSATVDPGRAPGGPGLLAVWWSFSEIALDPAGTVLESPNPDGDLTVGIELRLYTITGETAITETPPTNPSFDLFIRAVSYTNVLGRKWWVGVAGWS